MIELFVVGFVTFSKALIGNSKIGCVNVPVAFNIGAAVFVALFKLAAFNCVRIFVGHVLVVAAGAALGAK